MYYVTLAQTLHTCARCYIKNFALLLLSFLHLFCPHEMFHYLAPWNFPLLLYFCVKQFGF